MQHFFFIVSNGKFSRLDLEKIVCVVGIADRVQVHTTDEIHTPKVNMERIREQLPEERFIWIGKRMSVAKAMCK
ncbi:MAG: hypothetical protein DI535_07655 [Citrobacter freundii]|nr:MAG: hypothetical protein DI535_07655 [Citrobacter freundii]